MKTYIALLGCVLFNLYTYSQEHEKYYRIQLIGNPSEIISQLAQKGVNIDHAHISNERIIAEFSESEFNLIKQKLLYIMKY